jgi:hypothetical protein
MKYFNISLVAGVIMLAAATGMLRSQSLSTSKQAETAGFSTLLEMQSGRDLPIEEFEDRSLVFPRQTQG